MVFPKTVAVVDQKLSSLGIPLPYKIWRTDCAETWVNERKRHIFLNPEDRKSKVFAHQSMQHLLLHELGHIFCHKFVKKKIKSHPEIVELFGDLTKHYRRKLARVKSHRDYISNYARVHPEDNFCEVFAVYCGHEGKIRKIHKHLKKLKKSDGVKKQFLWLHKFVKEITKTRRSA